MKALKNKICIILMMVLMIAGGIVALKIKLYKYPIIRMVNYSETLVDEISYYKDFALYKSGYYNFFINNELEKINYTQDVNFDELLEELNVETDNKGPVVVYFNDSLNVDTAQKLLEIVGIENL